MPSQSVQGTGNATYHDNNTIMYRDLTTRRPRALSPILSPSPRPLQTANNYRRSADISLYRKCTTGPVSVVPHISPPYDLSADKVMSMTSGCSSHGTGVSVGSACIKQRLLLLWSASVRIIIDHRVVHPQSYYSCSALFPT